MDYYNRRKEAFKIIETLIEDSGTIKTTRICYIIAKKYGFSANFVQKSLKNLENLGFILINYDTVSWAKLKSPQEIKEEAEVDFLLAEQKYTPPDILPSKLSESPSNREEPILREDL